MSKEDIEYYDSLLFLWREYGRKRIALMELHTRNGTLRSEEHDDQIDAIFNEYIEGKAKLADPYNKKEHVT